MFHSLGLSEDSSCRVLNQLQSSDLNLASATYFYSATSLSMFVTYNQLTNKKPIFINQTLKCGSHFIWVSSSKKSGGRTCGRTMTWRSQLSFIRTTSSPSYPLTHQLGWGCQVRVTWNSGIIHTCNLWGWEDADPLHICSQFGTILLKSHIAVEEAHKSVFIWIPLLLDLREQSGGEKGGWVVAWALTIWTSDPPLKHTPSIFPPTAVNCDGMLPQQQINKATL